VLILLLSSASPAAGQIQPQEFNIAESASPWIATATAGPVQTSLVSSSLMSAQNNTATA